MYTRAMVPNMKARPSSFMSREPTTVHRIMALTTPMSMEAYRGQPSFVLV